MESHKCLCCQAPLSYVSASETSECNIICPLCSQSSLCFEDNTPKCPTFPFLQCAWSGGEAEIVKHCQEEHEDFFLEEDQASFVIPCKRSGNIFKLLHFDEKIFVARVNIENQNLSCEVIFPNNNQFKCWVKASFGVFTLRKAVPFCKETKLKLNSLRCGAKDPIHLEIELVDESAPKRHFLPLQLLLERLTCPVCRNLMRYPMFVDLGGSTVCRDCLLDMKESNSDIKIVPNFGLQPLTKFFADRCRFTQCDFRSKNEAEIPQHEDQCTHGNKAKMSQAPNKFL